MTLPLVISPGDTGHITNHEEIDELLSRLSGQADFLATGVLQDLLANMPAAGGSNLGMFRFVTDDTRLEYSDGGAWRSLASASSPNRFTDRNDFDGDVFFGSGKPWAAVKHAKYGAVGNNIADDTTPINNAIHDVGSGGEVLFDKGVYKTTAFLNGEGKQGLWLRGPPGVYGSSGARIVGSHTGKAILSLVGSMSVRIDGLVLEGDTATRPNTGLLLGRASSASAGAHTFNNLWVQGYYAQCGVYNVASEEDVWNNCYVKPVAAPIAGIYYSQGDQLGIGGLTGSSMECATHNGGEYGSLDATAGAVGVFLNCGGQTGYINFYSCFLPKTGGLAWVEVKLGSDGADTVNPIGFHNCEGEMGTAPVNGLYMTANAARLMWGFKWDVRLQMSASVTNAVLTDPGTVTLVNADFNVHFGTTVLPCSFSRVDGSTMRLFGASTITAQVSTSTHWYVRNQTAVPTFTTDNGGNWIIFQSGSSTRMPATSSPFKQATWGATITCDASLSNDWLVIPTSGIAHTIASPTNVIDTGQKITFTIRNTFGVMGATTWAAVFKLAAWGAIANGFSRSITFRWNGTNWVEISRTPADVPN